MFDFVRQHKRIMQLLLVILIFPSFVLFGIDGYKRFTSDSEVLATVDGVDIMQTEVDRMAQSEAMRISRTNPAIDVKIFDSPFFKSQILDQVINERVLQAAVSKFHIFVSDARLAQALKSAPELQAIKGSDGEIQRDAYIALLSSQGLTPQAYEFNLRSGLMSDALIRSITSTSLSESTSNSQAAWSQIRDVAWTRFDPSKLASSIKPSETELKKFFDENRNQFMTQESIEGEWLVLNAAQLAPKIELKPEDVKSYFEQNIQAYSVPEQRRARHILISVPQGAPASEIETAKNKIESIRSKLLANPSSFEAIAKTDSQDTGSARQGGDLGFFVQKDMVKPFADAAFALKKGEISPVIQSEFGFHVIQLIEVKPGQTQPFELVRPEIEKQLKTQLAQKRFAELAEQFTNLVYEQPDGLASIAKQLGLELKRFPATTRARLSTISPELAHPKVQEALFSPEGLAQKRNSAAIDIGSSTLVSARVIRHQSQRQLEFDEAQPMLIDQFTGIETLKMARQQAEELSKSSKSTLADQALISRVNSSKLSPKLIEAVMRKPADQLPVRFTVDEGKGGVYAVEVRAVKESEDVAVNQMSKMLMQRSYADAQTQAYVQSLRQQMNVKLKTGHELTGKVMPAR